MAPNPESRIWLGKERDALGQRRVELDLRLSEIDNRTTRVLARRLATELTRLEVGRVHIPQWLADEDGEWGDEIGWGHHHAGTTRMSDDPQAGVVNADCRLHGVENVFVIGSSVFPTCGYANPTLTIVALAMRLTDHLTRVLS